MRGIDIDRIMHTIVYLARTKISTEQPVMLPFQRDRIGERGIQELSARVYIIENKFLASKQHLCWKKLIEGAITLEDQQTTELEGFGSFNELMSILPSIRPYATSKK